MARSASSIQTQITALETAIAAAAASPMSVTADGVTVTHEKLSEMTKTLNMLYAQLDRINGTSPMLTRGTVRGMGG